MMYIIGKETNGHYATWTSESENTLTSEIFEETRYFDKWPENLEELKNEIKGGNYLELEIFENEESVFDYFYKNYCGTEEQISPDFDRYLIELFDNYNNGNIRYTLLLKIGDNVSDLGDFKNLEDAFEMFFDKVYDYKKEKINENLSIEIINDTIKDKSCAKWTKNK